MDTGDRRPGGRWRLAVAGLPLPLLVFLLGYRLSEESWSAAAGREVTSPLLVLPLVVFVGYAARRTRVDVGPMTVLRWLGSGLVISVGALGADVIPVGWLESVVDAVLLILAASWLGDGFRALVTGPQAWSVHKSSDRPCHESLSWHVRFSSAWRRKGVIGCWLRRQAPGR